MNSNVALQFQNCLREFTIDVIERPELVKTNFLAMIEPKISTQEYRDLIKFFISDLLNYKVEDETVDVIQTFTNQKNMSIEIELEKFQLLAQMIRDFSANHGGFVVKKICKKLHSNEKFNWFFMLLMIRCLDQQNEKVVEEFKSELAILHVQSMMKN